MCNYPEGAPDKGLAWCSEHKIMEYVNPYPTDVLIDFECSPLFRDYFYQRGFTSRPGTYLAQPAEPTKEADGLDQETIIQALREYQRRRQAENPRPPSRQHSNQRGRGSIDV